MNRRGAVEFETTDLERQIPGLADRMAPRKEALYRWLSETPEAAQRQNALRGWVAQTDKGGTTLRPWHQSLTPPGTARPGDQGVRDAREAHVAWNTPELKRRTLEQRIQSLVQRIMAAPEALRERLIAETVGEYWKEGMPVTQADLRAVAARYLNANDNHVRVTRTKGTGKV